MNEYKTIDYVPVLVCKFTVCVLERVCGHRRGWSAFEPVIVSLFIYPCKTNKNVVTLMNRRFTIGGVARCPGGGGHPRISSGRLVGYVWVRLVDLEFT